jgi:hypothetical protein
VSPDAPPPAHRIGRVEEEREEGTRWWMEMGMRKAHMMCVHRHKNVSALVVLIFFKAPRSGLQRHMYTVLLFWSAEY